jgi:hypothetical protein
VDARGEEGGGRTINITGTQKTKKLARLETAGLEPTSRLLCKKKNKWKKMEDERHYYYYHRCRYHYH